MNKRRMRGSRKLSIGVAPVPIVVSLTVAMTATHNGSLPETGNLSLEMFQDAIRSGSLLISPQTDSAPAILAQFGNGGSLTFSNFSNN